MEFVSKENLFWKWGHFQTTFFQLNLREIDVLGDAEMLFFPLYNLVYNASKIIPPFMLCNQKINFVQFHQRN